MGSALRLQSGPLLFVENVGQFDPAARFQVQGGGATLWLADDALWLTVVERAGEGTAATQLGAPVQGSAPAPAPAARTTVHLKLSFVGANPHPRPEPFGRLETRVS